MLAATALLVILMVGFGGNAAVMSVLLHGLCLACTAAPRQLEGLQSVKSISGV